MTASAERDRNLHMARVLLQQSRATPWRGWGVFLIERAGAYRRRAMLKQPEQVQHVLPIQQELFA